MSIGAKILSDLCVHDEKTSHMGDDLCCICELEHIVEIYYFEASTCKLANLILD